MTSLRRRFEEHAENIRWNTSEVNPMKLKLCVQPQIKIFFNDNYRASHQPFQRRMMTEWKKRWQQWHLSWAKDKFKYWRLKVLSLEWTMIFILRRMPISETPEDRVENKQRMGWNTSIWNSSYTSIELSETHWSLQHFDCAKIADRKCSRWKCRHASAHAGKRSFLKMNFKKWEEQIKLEKERFIHLDI